MLGLTGRSPDFAEPELASRPLLGASALCEEIVLSKSIFSSKSRPWTETCRLSDLLSISLIEHIHLLSGISPFPLVALFSFHSASSVLESRPFSQSINPLVLVGDVGLVGAVEGGVSGPELDGIALKCDGLPRSMATGTFAQA